MNKILALTALLAVVFVSNGQAAILDFPTTGYWAEKFDHTNNYIPYGLTKPVGGPIAGWTNGSPANNSLGYAYQFNLEQSIHLERIVFDIKVPDSTDFNADRAFFDWKIYGGTTGFEIYNYQPIPDINTLVVQNHAEFINNEVGDMYFNDVTTDLDIHLTPGTYWLAWERNWGDGGTFSHIQDVHGITGPEPSSLSLLSVGLVGFLRRRNKLTKYSS